ncbi:MULTISPECIES: transcription termination/antitermination protein NusG [unclassified Siphonobacter]|uniref:transcription termination/antitermination protein NusG n=1 Tax=unclassified Siphonobacter TaxID=2635712 RepID=UPI000CBDC98A|nr:MULTISPECIES: transcription termination/antitermination protein NusG [unclassified Siphonobacter]MDQ1086452.1 transcriptional antiterminator NusG [Siphonobacter sp. SORGH_AS_1065]MDR6196723.1 transcriptional antiterminator NusG [Siphonobacter sp. SORGH_AS_0500]PKK36108.1 transcription termination/antitermination factor NusG [Siphonobacter sp. SORGH_AS_0500]
MSNVNWYVLRAVSGQEKKVKSYLETEVARQELQESIPQILIPSEKIVEMRNGKKRIREKAFFPGYIMISADLSNGEVMHLITSMPGVIGFLGSNDKDKTKIPVPLRASEVKRMLGQVDEVVEETSTSSVSFLKGESVKVMDGPFSGFTGTIEEIFDDKKKLHVTVKIFGRNTPVELSYAQVEKEG